MKSLFGKYETFTEAASQVDRELHAALKPIFEKHIGDGYSVREIAHIAHGAVLMLECEKVMRRSIDLRKQEQADCEHIGAKEVGKNRLCQKCHKRWTVED